MILWKCLFELTSKNLEALKRKKRALDDLLSCNRISQQTYDSLNKDLNEALANAERYLESLVSKMKSRINDLEKQISLLEMFLANSEMMYAAGEIDYETYEKQSKALSTGIESIRREMSEINGILNISAPEPSMAKSVEATRALEITTPVITEMQNVGERIEQPT
ncbi:MAG: CdvA-like protein [Candidatus Bathyarchaeia archaeon]